MVLPCGPWPGRPSRSRPCNSSLAIVCCSGSASVATGTTSPGMPSGAARSVVPHRRRAVCPAGPHRRQPRRPRGTTRSRRPASPFPRSSSGGWPTPRSSFSPATPTTGHASSRRPCSGGGEPLRRSRGPRTTGTRDLVAASWSPSRAIRRFSIPTGWFASSPTQMGVRHPREAVGDTVLRGDPAAVAERIDELAPSGRSGSSCPSPPVTGTARPTSSPRRHARRLGAVTPGVEARHRHTLTP